MSKKAEMQHGQPLLVHEAQRLAATAVDLNAIETLRKTALDGPIDSLESILAERTLVATDVPILVAEIRRLRGVVNVGVHAISVLEGEIATRAELHGTLHTYYCFTCDEDHRCCCSSIALAGADSGEGGR